MLLSGRVMAGFKALKPSDNTLRNFYLGLIMSVMLFSTLRAQISPGELSRAHAILEGVENCEKCHSPKGDQLSDKCLACHQAIADERKTGTGLHGSDEYAECNLCHVEHHGRDFELIYFKGGKKNFDHRQTGFILDGKHRQLDCRQCHIPKYIKNEQIRGDKNINLRKSFLGLDSSCTNCHFDEHRGQLSGNCRSCHGTASWKPTIGFDHAQTAFALTGKHKNVVCEKCHVMLQDTKNSEDTEFRRFKPVAFAECTDCHVDTHKGRLGSDCTGCHRTDGWHNVKTARFDHDKTQFPLRGKHASVTCKQCHGQRPTTEPIKFAACIDCHSDFHNGAFASSPGHGACEECHTVDGFAPSTFDIARHDTTAFPLQGAHLAIPCRSCHVVSSAAAGKAQYKFVFESTVCRACHDDPHGGQVNRYIADGGCPACHSVETWRTVSFDHSTTKFALEGKHASVPCRDCHILKDSTNLASMIFQPLDTGCVSCHTGPHRGQFASAQGEKDCTACHDPSSWKSLTFDHDRDARFALEGAHRRVACNKCHLTETDASGSYTRYRPLDTRCESCHGSKPVKQESG